MEPVKASPPACEAYPGKPCSAGLPPVLDMCCGPRMMWFDKHDARATYIDKRKERHAMNRPMRGTVEWTETDPDQIADFTALPFPDASFDHVVFDPPHFERSGKIGYLAMKYGWLDGIWRCMLGFRLELPVGWFADMRPRSSIWKSHLWLSNSCGVVDAGYRGEVQAYFYAIPGANVIPPSAGDRVAQMILRKLDAIELVWVDKVAYNSTRGEGGFGSAGR